MKKSTINEVIRLRSTRRQLLKGAAAVGAAGVLGSPRIARAQAGKLLIYSVTVPSIQQRLADAFTAKTGIEVTSVRITPVQLAQRFLAEQRSQQFVCDVVTLLSDIPLAEASKEGFLTSLEGVPGYSNIPDRYRPSTEFFNQAIAPCGIGYNTNLLKTAPAAWTDLTSPEFTGQIVMLDPRLDESYLAFWKTMREAFGDDYLRQMGQQQMRLVPVTTQGWELVAAGDAKIVFPSTPASLYNMKRNSPDVPGAMGPVPTPNDPTFYYAGVAKNAPNMEGALKWIEFVCSPEGQAALCKDVLISVLGNDIPGSIQAPAQLIVQDFNEALKQKDEIFDLLNLPA